MKTPLPIHPAVRIGHVHLKVADLDRALAFYHGVLGFEVTQLMGRQAAFLSAGGYHHHIGLNTWESRGGSPPPPGTTGLYHVAILYPPRALMADALRRLLAAGIQLDGASDHGVSEALYLRDPDDNGVELYWDRSQEQWPRNADGALHGAADLRVFAMAFKLRHPSGGHQHQGHAATAGKADRDNFAIQSEFCAFGPQCPHGGLDLPCAVGHRVQSLVRRRHRMIRHRHGETFRGFGIQNRVAANRK